MLWIKEMIVNIYDLDLNAETYPLKIAKYISLHSKSFLGQKFKNFIAQVF